MSVFEVHFLPIAAFALVRRHTKSTEFLLALDKLAASPFFASVGQA